MPSSDPRVLEGTCREIIIANPKTVLDIGVGFGKWGMLAREYTDIWNYRFYQNEWETHITGIEIHEPYRNPTWQLYNEVVIGDADSLLDLFAKEGRHFQLTLMIDVLEHFEKEKGLVILKKVMAISDQFLVSYANSEQKDVRDNKYEDHVSTWEDGDFRAYKRKPISGGKGWGVYLLSR